MVNKKSKSNVFSTGGGGHVFENSVQAAYVIAMMVEGTIPGLPKGKIVDIRLQAKSSTDDMVIKLINSSDGSEHKLFSQIKHNLTFTSNDSTFQEVLSAFWRDYKNDEIFNPTKDKLAFIIGGLGSKERNHIKPVLNWAKVKSTFDEYQEELKSSNAKQDVFKIFCETLQKTNGESITQSEVWEFLKVVELFDYDFVNDNSVDKSFILTLIDAYNSTEKTPEDIWGVIFENVSKKNSQGATITSNDIKEEYPFFGNRSPKSREALEKLFEEGNLLLERIRNCIGDFHLNRSVLSSKIESSILTNDIAIISGQAGIGKSAFAKQILGKQKDHIALCFAADQFNRTRLSETFSELGIVHNIIQVFAHYSLYSEKVIYLDSFEKLLEGEAEAFRELLVLVKKHKIKLILSCRDYAVDTLLFKYDLRLQSDSIYEIPVLDEDELKVVEKNLPDLKDVLQNEKLKDLLNRPKYLDFSFRLVQKTEDELKTIGEIDFKQKLWDHIVKEISIQKDGLHEKRETLFVEIAVRRAKSMSLYTDIPQLDGAVVQALHKDGIVSKSDNLYAPSHDILEDWALIRHIKNLRVQNADHIEFYKKLSVEPAIRRAFRLWLEELILAGEPLTYEFICKSILSEVLERHWKDEVAVAILGSNLAKNFFTDNSEELLADNNSLLIRFIHLLRVGCKDTYEKPKGPGWEMVTEFVYQNISDLTNIYPLLTGLFIDWRAKVYRRRDRELPNESLYVALSLLEILESYRKKEISIGDRRFEDDQIKKCIELLFNLTSVVENEIKNLLLEAYKSISTPRQDDQNWKSRSFYEDIIEYALSGLHCGALPELLPDLLIEIANKEWKEEKQKSDRDFYSRDEVEDFFGIAKEYKRDCYPPSAYQTFISKLLVYHPIKAFDFIIDFISYATEKYQGSKFHNQGLIELKFKISDKEIVQKGSQVLWQIYRGTGVVTPYLLQSILMALERYLYNFGKIGSANATQNLNFSIDYLFERTDSVAITSVLSSVVMAYPNYVENRILLFLQCPQFLDWDSTRWLNDRNHLLIGSPGSTLDQYHFDVERKEAEQWEHRKKYYRGLMGFITDYQIRNGSYNKEIHKQIDVLKGSVDQSDLMWQKMLTEIDTRKWKVERVEDQPNILTIQPNYEGDVKEMVESFEDERKEVDVAAAYWQKVNEYYDKKVEESIDLKFWKECKAFYEKTKSDPRSGFAWSPIMFAVPGRLVFLGLKNLELDDDDFHWSVAFIIGQIEILITKDDEFGGPLDFSVNIMDHEPLFEMLPYLSKFKDRFSKDDYEKTKNLILTACLKLENRLHHDMLIKSISQNLWKYDMSFARSLFFGILHYSNFHEQLGRKRHYNQNLVEVRTIDKAEREILENILKENYSLENTELSVDYENCSLHFLKIAIQILSNNLELDFLNDFLILSFKIHLEAIERENRTRSIASNFDVGLSLRKLIAEYLLLSPNATNANSFFNDLLLVSLDKSYTDYEQSKYIRSLFENIYLAVDARLGFEKDDEIIKRFWELWQQLFEKIKDIESSRLTGSFLLHCQYWKGQADHWKPFEFQRNFFDKSISSLKKFESNYLLELISGIGFQTLMPQGITWLVEAIQKYDSSSNINFYNGEKLVQRTYQSHTKELKENKKYLEDFIWFLDALIDLGSSQAYVIRENLIVFKESRR